jgi:hypothetical protein
MARTGAESRGTDERVASLETTVSNLVTGFEDFQREIRSTLKHLTSQVAPNISTWIAAGGLAVGVSGLFVTVGLAIGGIVLSGFARDMGRMEGYFRERADANLMALRDLDTALQREMRTLDDAMVIQVAELDKRLQHEQDLKLDISQAEREAQIAKLESKLLRMEIERLKDQVATP